jgi:hypothetical protein
MVSKLYNSPLLFGLVVFGSIFVVGTIAGLILGLVVLHTATCPNYLGDPCDAGPMVAVAFWSVSPVCSAVIGLISGIFCLFVLRRKSRSLPKVVP